MKFNSIPLSIKMLTMHWIVKLKYDTRTCHWLSFLICKIWNYSYIYHLLRTDWNTHCVKNRHTFSSLKSIVWYISINYLTTNEPYQIKIQKFQKIRKTYSPDPEFRKFETNFFLKCIVVNIFHETNFSLKWFLLWVALWNRPHI